MKRREFIKASAAGMPVVLVGCSTAVKKAAAPSGPGFDVHPFVKAHPEAVFIHLTSIESKKDEEGIRSAAHKLADELIVSTPAGEGYPSSTRIACKPNWTSNPPVDGKSSFDYRGINTDPFFVEGFLQSVRARGPQDISLRECASPQNWPVHGYTQMAERNGFDLRDLTSKNFWEYKKNEFIFREVPDGIVFKEIAFQAPITAPDTFLINIAKFKAHGMGITACIKNLQGVSGRRFHQMCSGSADSITQFEKQYSKYFHPNYLDRIAELQTRHIAEGYARWDRPESGGGFWMEQWAQRMLDSFSLTPAGINIVEGVYGRDGNGFAEGPHDGKGMDFMANNVIFGMDAFRVDIITHWLAGHEPGNFGLFRIGIERGMSDVLDPFDIPIYLWDEGRPILTRLDWFKRTPLVTYYLQRDYNGGEEPKYHLVDEPFDYTSWKHDRALPKPAVAALGNDSRGRVAIEVRAPKPGDACMDILDRHGRLIWRMEAPNLSPGIHQVVWDGFASPGIHNIYVRGMGWDAQRQMVVYS